MGMKNGVFIAGKVQVQYFKTLFGVKMTRNSAVVYCDTGRFPMKLKVVKLF